MMESTLRVLKMVLQIHYHLLFSLTLFLLLPCLIAAQTYQNISLGSSLTASEDNSSWLSPSGDFAFGFQPIGTTGFLLAIWFDKIPDKTIVWSANGPNLAQRGSKLELTTTGLLVLNNPQGQEIWKVDFSDKEVAYGAMLDSGSFMLGNKNSSKLWDTFGVPTDTILPTQLLNPDSILAARQTENDYSSGRFQLRLQTDGNIMLYTMAFPTTYVNDHYWASNTTGGVSQVAFNQSGFIYVQQANGSVVQVFPSNPVPTNDFYQRATLDYDGVFRHYVYPKPSRSSSKSLMQSWSTMSFVPPNICLTTRGLTGSGVCGYNSYCKLDDNQRPHCECPPGYSYLDPNNSFKGCKQNFVSQRCDGSKETSEFDFKEVMNTDWPLSDFEFFQKVNEDWCREFCLSDCFCPIAVFKGSTCYLKRFPLSNGRMDSNFGGKTLVKVRRVLNSSLIAPNTSCSSNKNDHSRTLILTGSVLLGCSWFLTLMAVLAICVFIFRSCSKKPKKLSPDQITSGVSLRSYSFKELEKATNGFKETLGSGAFATVYKGLQESDDQKLIAVKRLDKLRDGEKGFKTELNAIARTNHKNLVQLLGFCNEGPHWLLVYEFMSNGSLASYLFGDLRPNWYQRLQIVFGVARGLMYLHEECCTQIIHCDIKPQNILLDDCFTARISDFGLAKLLKTDQSRTNTGIRGTKGYVAPEWFKGMTVTAKVDVYSFGVVLLEVLCCRRNVEQEQVDEDKVILIDWSFDCYREGRLCELIENDEEAIKDMETLQKLVKIAIWCIQEEPSLRPTMKKVTQMMEGTVEVSAPPDPSCFISSIG